jgi:DNA invertase Pin-like site-specific DNA recombinase
MSRALGYIRVSSYVGRDRAEALTEDVQLEKIRQWCAVADLELVDVLRDVDRSGKSFDRPAFNSLLARLRAGEASAVVVYRMSRFGRDFYETIRTVRQLRDEGIVFHSASERLDLESPNGRLMFNVLASFDEYELDIRREYWAETKARVMKERGVHLGRTPLGYLRASKQPKHACDVSLARAAELLAAWRSSREPVSGGLIPDPMVAPSIARAFALRASGAQYTEIIAMLNREAPRPESRLWTHTHVARMMTLRVYLGEVGQADLVVPDAHESLVDEATFAAAQIAPKRQPSRSPTAEFHLRGVLRCAGCGFPMTGWNQPRVRASGAVDRVRVYRCVRQRVGGKCQERAVVSADAVEQIVRDAVEPHLRHLAAETPLPAATPLPGIDAELAQIDERLRRLSGELQAELDADTWQDLVTEHSRRRRQLRALRGQAGGGVLPDTITWSDLTAAEQFEVIREGISAVMVRKAQVRRQPIEERIEIYPAGTVDHLFPSKANDWRITPFDFAAAERALSDRADEPA